MDFKFNYLFALVVQLLLMFVSSTTSPARIIVVNFSRSNKTMNCSKVCNVTSFMYGMPGQSPTNHILYHDELMMNDFKINDCNCLTNSQIEASQSVSIHHHSSTFDLKKYFHMLETFVFLVMFTHRNAIRNSDEVTSKKLLLFKVAQSLSKPSRPRFTFWNKKLSKFIMRRSIRNLNKSKSSNNIFTFLEPDTTASHFYIDQFPILVDIAYSDTLKMKVFDYHICVSLNDVSHSQDSKIVMDESNTLCSAVNVNELLISGLNSGTYNVYVSVTNKQNIIITSVIFVVDIFNSKAYNLYIGNTIYDQFIQSIHYSSSLESELTINTLSTQEKLFQQSRYNSFQNYYFEAMTTSQGINYNENDVIEEELKHFFILGAVDHKSNSLDDYMNTKDNSNSNSKSNILLYFKDFDLHSANQRLVYWACESQKLYTNHTTRNNQSTTLPFIITHVIAPVTLNATDDNMYSYSIYNQLRECGITVFTIPCSVAPYGEICLDSLINNNQHQPTHNVNDVTKNQSFCQICLHNMIRNIQLIKPLFAIYLNSHGDPSTDYFLIVMRKYFPNIHLGIDLPNIKIPLSWIDCCIDFIIAPSLYVSLDATVRNVQKPIFSIYPPLDPLFVKSALSLQDINQLCSLNDSQDDDIGSQVEEEERSELSDVSNNNNNNTSTNPSQDALSDNIRFDNISFIYVGRMSNEKCPGAILRAISLIVSCLHTNNNSNNNNNNNYDDDDDDDHRNSIFCKNYSIIEIQSFLHYSQVHFYGDGPLKNQLIELSILLKISQNNTSTSKKNIRDKFNYKSSTTPTRSSNTNSSNEYNVVSFHPYETNRTKLAWLMHQADYLINPRLTGETFGFIHIESLVMLTPVIAFNTGANRESMLSHYEEDYFDNKKSMINESNFNVTVTVTAADDDVDDPYLQTTTRNILINHMTVDALADAFMIAFLRKQSSFKHNYKKSHNENESNNNKHKHNHYYYACQKRREILSKLTLQNHITDLYEALSHYTKKYIVT